MNKKRYLAFMYLWVVVVFTVYLIQFDVLIKRIFEKIISL